MKRLLITGFEPFGGEQINPSWESVKLLPDIIGEYELKKLLIPVSFTKAAERIISLAEEITPNVILSIGQAGGRDAVTPELVAINVRYAVIPDNDGYTPHDEPIIPNGQNAYFSTLPVRNMAKAINDAGVPSKVSYSAGAYVCNDVHYTLLNRYNGTSTRVGFIHIPYSDDQNKTPSMPIDVISKALITAIKNID